jgi:hypothetical protein
VKKKRLQMEFYSKPWARNEAQLCVGAQKEEAGVQPPHFTPELELEISRIPRRCWKKLVFISLGKIA